MLELIPDCRINRLESAAVEDGEFDMFNSKLKGIPKIIKYSGPGQKEKMRELLQLDDICKDFERDEIDVLNFCVNAGLKINKNKAESMEGIRTVWDEIR